MACSAPPVILNTRVCTFENVKMSYMHRQSWLSLAYNMIAKFHILVHRIENNSIDNSIGNMFGQYVWITLTKKHIHTYM